MKRYVHKSNFKLPFESLIIAVPNVSSYPTMQAIVCPATVELSTLFDSDAAHRTPTLALQLLKELAITTPEDMYTAYPRLFDPTLLEAELKKISTAMKNKGEAMQPIVVWTTNEAAEPGATEIPLLRRVIHRQAGAPCKPVVRQG